MNITETTQQEDEAWAELERRQKEIADREPAGVDAVALQMCRSAGLPDDTAAALIWRIAGWMKAKADPSEAEQAAWVAGIHAGRQMERGQPSGNSGELDDRAEFEAWLYLDQTEYEPDDLNKREIEIARLAFQTGRAALQSQDREDSYIPKKRKDYVASITDSDGHIAQREGYVEGWNDCRQDIIDHARRIEENE